MQISSLPVITQSSAQTQRSDITEHRKKDVQRDPDQNNNDIGSLEQLNARSEDVLQQRVESSNANSGIEARQRAKQELPLTAQRALQSFTENSLSSEQRLGIELAGVDTFA